MEKKRKRVAPTKKNEIKTFRAQINCTCKRKCADLIDVVTQKEIFDKYYNLPNWSKKTKFLRTIVNRKPVNENVDPVANAKKRDFFCEYHLNDSNGENCRVCSSFVENLLQINRHKIFRAIRSKTKNPSAEDRRGKSSRSKTKPEDIALVREFIRSFPYYESNVKSNASNIKYFHPRLTLQKIFELYRNVCLFKQRVALSKNMFDRLLKKNFPHLKPYQSVKSKCDMCQHFNQQKKRKVLSPEQNEKNREDANEHISSVKSFKENFMQSIKDAEENNIEVLTFELQRPLEIPCVSVEESYDWRQLWFSNLCVYDEVRRKPYMYVWDESVAKRGPEEIASCLFKHIFKVVPKTAKKVVLYCDFSDLYRNMRIVLMLKKLFDYLSNSELTIIEQRFFMPGHNYNGCNRCFDLIDKLRRATNGLFTPDDWIRSISSAKQTFTVHKMNGNDFYSVQPLIRFLTSETTTASGQQINWPHITSIIYNRSEPLHLNVTYKNSESAVFLVSSCDSSDFQSTKLVYCCKDGNPISKSKFDNLQHNLKYVPSACHEYYGSLKYDEKIADADFALASYD